MSTFYAVIQDPREAEQAVVSLLEQGVPADDISLVVKTESGSDERPKINGHDEIPSMPDASAFVGRPDDPDEPIERDASDREEPYFARESPVGAGISSADSNAVASTVDETDDAQALAEESLEHEGIATQGENEVRDLELAIETGFPTVGQELESARDAGNGHGELPAALERVHIDGFGYVLGGGALATAALDFADGDPSDDWPELKHHFEESGVPESIAGDYFKMLSEGKAILSVGLEPGRVEPPLMDDLVRRIHAERFGTFDAPRW